MNRIASGSLRLASLASVSCATLAWALAAASAPDDPCPPKKPCWPTPAKVPHTGPFGHPGPQPPMEKPEQKTDAATDTTTVTTKEVMKGGSPLFKSVDPFRWPPGTNFLPNVYTNAYDGRGVEMVNTLPSRPDAPYNLHDGDPDVTRIHPASPSDDLRYVFDNAFEILTGVPPRRLWEEPHDARRKFLATKAAVGTPPPMTGSQPYVADPANIKQHVALLKSVLDKGIAILEGGHVAGRAYSGPEIEDRFPLLHINGPHKIKKLVPIRDIDGRICGGNVDVHQVWFDGRIESDAMFVDLSAFDAPADPSKPDAEQAKDVVPWTMTYTIDVLNRGRDDFAPFAMFFDHPDAAKAAPAMMQRDVVTELKLPKDKQLLTRPEAEKSKAAPEPEKEEEKLPHIAMDQTFFPIEEGTRTVLKIKMPPPVYYKLVYTWGWRRHPPRAQALEADAKLKELGGPECKHGGEVVKGKKLSQYEKDVFGDAPLCSDAAKESAISKISDLSPAKRMWKALKAARQDVDTASYQSCILKVVEGYDAFLDWKTRTSLPHIPDEFWDSGTNTPKIEVVGAAGTKIDDLDFDKDLHRIKPDPDTDYTLLYVNNTIYGELKDGGMVDIPKWRERQPAPGSEVSVTIYNADYYHRAYMAVDFGGARGWENQFKATEPLGGSGCRFTFGRAHWSMVLKEPIRLCPARPANPMTGEKLKVFKHIVKLKLHYEPSRRLRLYQFDQLHHDVAIFSLH